MKDLRASILTYFLISYLPLLLIPVAVGTMIYMRTAAVFTDEIVHRNVLALQQSKQVFDIMYSLANDLSVRIDQNYSIMQLVDIRSSSIRDRIYEVRAAQRELSKYVFRTMGFNNLYVWFNESELLLTLDTSYIDTSFHSEHLLKFSTLTYPQWRQSFMQRRFDRSIVPSSTVVSNGRHASVLAIVQSFPIKSPGENDGFILVTYHEDFVVGQLRSAVDATGGWAAILDRDGNVVTFVDEQWSVPMTPARFSGTGGTTSVEIDGEPAIAIYETSMLNDLQFISIIPERLLLAKVGHIRNLMIIAGIVMVAIGLAIAIIFALRRSRAIIDIAANAHLHPASHRISSVIEEVATGVRNMDASNLRLRREIEIYMPHLRTSMLTCLLSGQVASDEEIDLLLPKAGLDLSGSLFCVLLIRLAAEADHHSDDSVVSKSIGMDVARRKLILNRTIEAALPVRRYLLDTGVTETVAIVNSDSADKTRLRREVDAAISRARNELLSIHRIAFGCAGGGMYSHASDLHLSFYEARSVVGLRHVFFNEDPVVWYAMIPAQDGLLHYYPVSEEQRLISIVKSGDFLALQTLLRAIVDRNVAISGDKPNLSSVFLYEILATLHKCAWETGFEDWNVFTHLGQRIESAVSIEDAHELLSLVESCYEMLCDYVEQKKRSHNSELGLRIRQYVCTNYTDRNLCLKSIADIFNMAETYFSQFFKEQIGEGFHAYLETLRLNEAERLLQQGCTVDYTADAVGYNSSNTFRQAYKRRTGIPPSAAKRSSLTTVTEDS